jgi:hypothetical protein
VCSASGADKEEQGQEAKEEGACCVECIPVDTLRTLISRFDNAVIIIRWRYALYQSTVPMHMNIRTYTCQAMSVAMLPRQKHDVRLCDERVCVLPCIPILPLFQAQIRKISDRFSPDVIVAACFGAILRRATIHGDLSTVCQGFTVLAGKRSAGEHISVRHIHIRATRSTFNLLCNYTIQQRDVSTQHGKDYGEHYGVCEN